MLSSHYFCSGIGARLFESDLAQPCLGVVQVSRCLPARTLSGHLPIRTPTYVLNNPLVLVFPHFISTRHQTSSQAHSSFDTVVISCGETPQPSRRFGELADHLHPKKQRRRSGPRDPGVPPFGHGVATSSVEICESGVRSPR